MTKVRVALLQSSTCNLVDPKPHDASVTKPKPARSAR